jgi:hypothetical protein
MVRRLEDLTDASVQATDGDVGKVRNFLFDDQLWKVRYLVVEVGHWLARRDVVLAVSSIDRTDWDGKVFRVRLTKDQIRQSPDVDSTRPVSRRQEVAMSEHYGWTGYWEDRRDLDTPLVSQPVGREYPAPAGEDPHLRSAEAVLGYEVWATDGEIGRVENYIVDDAAWHIGYLDVKLNEGFPTPMMWIPTEWVRSLSWGAHKVALNHAGPRMAVPPPQADPPHE